MSVTPGLVFIVHYSDFKKSRKNEGSDYQDMNYQSKGYSCHIADCKVGTYIPCYPNNVLLNLQEIFLSPGSLDSYL